MGCGCGRNKGIRGVGKRPIVAPRIRSSSAAPAKPRANQVQAQSTDKKAGGNKDKKAIEKKRREDILRRLGRL